MTPHSPPFRHPNPYQPIPSRAALIKLLFILHKQMAHGRIPYPTIHAHPHTPVQTYPQWYTHGDITTVINLDTMDNHWNTKICYEDQDITQRLWSTPTLSLLCWLFRMFSYTLLIKIYLVLIIYFSIMCHHVVFSGRDFAVSINSQPIPRMTSVVIHYPYRVPPPRIRPLFYPDMYQHLARQSHHTHTNNFFSV